MLAKAKLALSITFIVIVLASFTIVTYDHQNMFIIQANGVSCECRNFIVKLIFVYLSVSDRIHNTPFSSFSL